jgi:predicted solute-binding protein
MDGGIWIPVVVVVGVFALTIVIVWQAFATARARALVAREQQYRDLAERSTRAAEHLDQTLADIQERVRWIEKTMREVG